MSHCLAAWLIQRQQALVIMAGNMKNAAMPALRAIPPSFSLFLRFCLGFFFTHIFLIHTVLVAPTRGSLFLNLSPNIFQLGTFFLATGPRCSGRYIQIHILVFNCRLDGRRADLRPRLIPSWILGSILGV